MKGVASTLALSLLAIMMIANPVAAQSYDLDISNGLRAVYGLYDYAIGTTGNSCLTCGFFGYFSGALNLISQTVFMFARGYALTLIPVIGALYILFQVGKELSAGDTKPSAFLSSKIKTIIAFSVAMMVISGSPIAGIGSGSTTLHTITGPGFLQATFNLSSEVRSAIALRMEPAQGTAITRPKEATYEIPSDQLAMYNAAVAYHQARTQALIIDGGYPAAEAQEYAYRQTVKQYPAYVEIKESLYIRDELNRHIDKAIATKLDPLLGCQDIDMDQVEAYISKGQTIDGHQKSAVDTNFIRKATEQTCFIERVHMIGFATGLSVLLSDAQAGDGGVNAYGNYLIDSLVQIITGLLFMYIFGVSAIYLIFLVLDIVVRGLITASLSPVLAMLALFPSGRPLVKQAVAQLVGAVGTAIALSIAGGVAITLFFKTVDVYNSVAEIGGQYADLRQLPIGPSLLGYRDFLTATMGEMNGMPRVPLTFSAPWTWYLILSGLAIPAIGKAIIKLIESVLGTQGQDTLAQTALNTAKTSMALAQQGGQLAALSSLAASKTFAREGGQAAGRGFRSMFPGQDGTIQDVSGNAAQRVIDATGGQGLSDGPAAGRAASDIMGGNNR